MQWFGVINYYWCERTRTFGSDTLFTRPAPGKDAEDTVDFLYGLLTKYKFRTDSVESVTSDNAPVSHAHTMTRHAHVCVHTHTHTRTYARWVLLLHCDA
jgi:hypothetical protein